MDLYHSRLTPDDLNDLIIKYKIPRDLHHRLPLEDYVMSELPNNAIGIYHRMFDFSGVRIPFSSFLLAVAQISELSRVRAGTKAGGQSDRLKAGRQKARGRGERDPRVRSTLEMSLQGPLLSVGSSGS
ncbi:hypothetical protein Tco_0889892 [Tanacetum coccineum]